MRNSLLSRSAVGGVGVPNAHKLVSLGHFCYLAYSPKGPIPCGKGTVKKWAFHCVEF